MAVNKDQCIQQIQNTIDLLYRFKEFENKAFVKALALGIQGKKREGRLAGTEDDYIIKYFQSEAFDLFEAELYPNENHAPFPAVNNVETFLAEYRNGLWEMYWKLSEAGNTFIVPLCLDDLSVPLKKRAKCIKKAIVDLNRKIKRWNAMKEQGTALHDLYIYETSQYNVHDEAEAKENEIGYNY